MTWKVEKLQRIEFARFHGMVRSFRNAVHQSPCFLCVVFCFGKNKNKSKSNTKETCCLQWDVPCLTMPFLVLYQCPVVCVSWCFRASNINIRTWCYQNLRSLFLDILDYALISGWRGKTLERRRVCSGTRIRPKLGRKFPQPREKILVSRGENVRHY